MTRMIGPRRLPSRGSGRVPVGPLVFKTSGAALGAARWVRLPRVPATEDRDCRIARVPRASSGCWSRPGRCCAAGGDPDALTAIAREVVAGERARLAAGEPPTDVAALAAAVAERLDGFGGPDEPAPVP